MKRSVVYIFFSFVIILVFFAFVRQLDAEAVSELEIAFNEQQALQVGLAKRSLEEQFNWQLGDIARIAQNISINVKNQYYYDSTGKRLLYVAKSVNHIDDSALEAQLSNILDNSLMNDSLFWAYFSPEDPLFIPTQADDPSNASYQEQIDAWYTDHQELIDNQTEAFVTPFYADEDHQYYAIFYPLLESDGSYRGSLGAIFDFSRAIDQFIVPIRSGKFGAAWLQDGMGCVVFDHEVGIIGQNVADLHADYPAIQALDARYLVDLSGQGEYSFTTKRGGEISRKLVAWNTALFLNQQLTIALSAPDTEISALLYTSRQTSSIVSILLVIVLIASNAILFYLQQTDLRRLVKARTAELEREHHLLQAEITERKQTESALRESETNFRQLAENIREVFFLIDAETQRILYVSPSYHAIWQCQEDMRNRPFNDLIVTVHPDHLARIKEEVAKFNSNPQTLSTEFQILRGSDHEARWIRWRAFPVLDESGQMTRVIGTGEDITERKQALKSQINVEIERKRTLLLANFVQDAFHEFRTPLSIINTSVYLLDKIEDAERRREHLQYIREESGNIMHLVEQLVTMARLDAEEPFRQDIIHMDTLLKDLEILTDTEFKQSQTYAIWQLDADNSYVRGDQEQLYRAIKNILMNAIKYSQNGDNIVLRTMVKDDQILIEIHDTGEGIQPEDLSNIFNRFYRVDKAHSTRGFGLGLPISQRIIERHNGQIIAESTPGQGSLFRIVLPLATGRQISGETEFTRES